METQENNDNDFQKEIYEILIGVSESLVSIKNSLRNLEVLMSDSKQQTLSKIDKWMKTIK